MVTIKGYGVQLGPGDLCEFSANGVTVLTVDSTTPAGTQEQTALVPQATDVEVTITLTGTSKREACRLVSAAVQCVSTSSSTIAPTEAATPQQTDNQ
jgi:hypothetical protein